MPQSNATMAIRDQYRTDTAQRYIRSMTRYLEQMGYTYTQGQVTPLTYIEDEKTRYRVWLCESIAWACERVLQEQWVLVLRGTLQVYEYAAKIGHDSVSHDAAYFLRNALEDAIGGDK